MIHHALEVLHHQLKRYMALSGFLAVTSGIVFGYFIQSDPLRYFIPVALFFMLYPSMLDVRLQNLASLLTQPKLPAVALVMNFVLSPLMIAGIAYLFKLDDPPYLLTGIILYGIVPCGGMIAAFTVMLRGNAALTVLMITLSHPLSLVMVPFWSHFLIGRVVLVSPFLILKHLFIIIVVPWFLAELTRRFVFNRIGENGVQRIKSGLMILPNIGFLLLQFVILALNSRNIVNEPWLVMRIVFPVGLFLVFLILTGKVFSKLLGLNRADAEAMVMSTSAKNNAISMALALSAFGTDVGMVIAFTGPLTQFPIMITYLKIAQPGIPEYAVLEPKPYGSKNGGLK